MGWSSIHSSQRCHCDWSVVPLMGKDKSWKTELALSPGQVVKGRWSVARLLGSGGFGAVYEVSEYGSSTKKHYAMKMEPNKGKHSATRMEVAVLKTFQRHGRPDHICEYIQNGQTAVFRFVVMELVGRSLWDLRKDTLMGRFSESTTIRLGMQCLEAIENVHRIGFIHRDVKPANFAMGIGKTARLAYILDFGLARQYITRDGDLRPPRRTAGFRGTLRYASINVHARHDAGRHDDLWSWLYVMLEFRRGELPWCNMSEKDEVGMKKKTIVADQLLKGMAREYHQILNELQGLHFIDTPNYASFYMRLKAIAIRQKYKESDPFDWEP